MWKKGDYINSVWIHNEFDFNDVQKYLKDRVIKTDQEAERLNQKYKGANYKTI